MNNNSRPSGPAGRWTGITRLTTEDGSLVFVDWDLWAYRRCPGTESRELDRNAPWLHFTDIGAIEIGRCATIGSAGTKPGSFISSPVVAIEPVVPARELSATELETVRFVGTYINLRGHSPRRTDR